MRSAKPGNHLKSSTYFALRTQDETRSLTIIANKRGPSLVPWGIPALVYDWGTRCDVINGRSKLMSQQQFASVGEWTHCIPESIWLQILSLSSFWNLRKLGFRFSVFITCRPVECAGHTCFTKWTFKFVSCIIAVRCCLQVQHSNSS